MKCPGTVWEILTLVAVVALLGVALTGCRPQQETMDEVVDVVPPEPEPEPEPDADTAGTGEDAETGENVVQVTLLDGEIEMPDTLTAGATIFEISNVGALVHNLEIEGQGIEEVLENDLQPGESATLTVDLQPGTYEVYCPVADHAERGMRLTLTVTE